MSNLTVKGNASGTGTVILEAPNTNTNRTITLPDSTSTLATTADVAAIATGPTLGTAVSSTSGTAIDFTGIPSTAKRVTVMFNGVSTNGSSIIAIQLGDSGGIETSGYVGVAARLNTNANLYSASFTSSALIEQAGDLALVREGFIAITKITGDSWVFNGATTMPGFAGYTNIVVGSKTLSATLDRVRITTVNGTDTFDAGTINISWE